MAKVYKNMKTYVDEKLNGVSIGDNGETIIDGTVAVRGPLVVQENLTVLGRTEIKKEAVCNAEFEEV